MTIHDAIARDVPQLRRGQVWCRTCGRMQRVDGAGALRTSCPRCCGHTMTIDSPEEQQALAARAQAQAQAQAQEGEAS